MLLLANYKPIFLGFIKLKSNPADRYLWASVKAEWFKGEVVNKPTGLTHTALDISTVDVSKRPCIEAMWNIYNRCEAEGE